MADDVTRERLATLGFSGTSLVDASESTGVRLHPGGRFGELDGAFMSLLEDGLVVLTPLRSGAAAWRPLVPSTAVVVHEVTLPTLDARLAAHRAEVARLAHEHGPPARLTADMAIALGERVDQATARAAIARLAPAFGAAVAAAWVAWVWADAGAWPLALSVFASALVGPSPGWRVRALVLLVAVVALRRFDGAAGVGLVAVATGLGIGALQAIFVPWVRYQTPLVRPANLGGGTARRWLLWVLAGALGVGVVTGASTRSFEAGSDAGMAILAPIYWVVLLRGPAFVWFGAVGIGALWTSVVLSAGPALGSTLVLWTVGFTASFAGASFTPRVASGSSPVAASSPGER